MRREYIKQYWFQHGKPPSIEHLQKQWKLRRRTLQKDINAVIDEIKDPEVVDYIRTKFLWELNTRIPEMKDVDFVKLTKHFIPEKVETRVEADIVTVVKPSISWESLDEDERRKLIEAGRILIKQRRDSEKGSTSIH